MKEIILKTITVLKKLNQSIDNKAIKEKEFIEEIENAEDFEKLIKQLTELLNDFDDKSNLKNKDWVNEKIIQLHLIYSYLEWHLEQVHGLIDKIIKKYPD